MRSNRAAAKGAAAAVFFAASCILSSCSVEVKPGYYPPFIKAAQEGDIREASRILLSGHDINETTAGNSTAMHVAALEGRSEMVSWLMAHEAAYWNPDAAGKVPYQLANERGHKDTAKLIYDFAVLMQDAQRAASAHDLDALDRILASDPRGYTALHYYAEAGDYGAVGDLIKKNKDVNAKTGLGVTPLMKAAAVGNGVVVTQLLKAGADVNARSIWDDTALFAAAAGGHEYVTGLLLKAGADPGVRTKMLGGTTALEYAEKRGYSKVADLLRRKEA